MTEKSSSHLYYKLFYIYTAIILGIVCSLVAYFISSTRSQILETNLNYTKMMCEEAAGFLNDTYDTASYIQTRLYQSPSELADLLCYLQYDPETYLTYRLDKFASSSSTQYNGIEDFISNAFEGYRTITRIDLVGYQREDVTTYYPDGGNYRNKDRDKILSGMQEGNWSFMEGFSFSRELRNPDTLESIGCLIVTFDSSRFSSIHDYYSKAELLIFNHLGSKIFDSAEKTMPSVYDKAAVPKEVLDNKAEDYFHAYTCKKEVKDYQILAYLKKKDAAHIPLPLIITILSIGIALVFSGVIFIHWYLNRLTNRLNLILSGMEQVKTGNLQVQLQVNKNGDELDLISENFNSMCRELDLYIKKSYLAEIEQKNAEMEALQSQINPHFLYNTLEAIRMKAILNGDREVGKMLYSMAVTFRSQIKEADIITLVQELHYCKKYLELFEYRYPGKFHSSVTCPEELMDTPIIKFVLQPVIENYFIHGIRRNENDNRIKIYAAEDGAYTKIIVEDNGNGMEPQALMEKNKELCEDKMDKSKSIGIANVNRRLKAVYGNAFGITLEAADPQGLRIILLFNPSVGETKNPGI